jgi:putative transposase
LGPLYSHLEICGQIYLQNPGKVWAYPGVEAAVTPDGPDVLDGDDVVDVFLQARRDGAAAKRFFRRLLRSHGGEPRKVVTDKLRSYGVAHRELLRETIHSTQQYENNRAEQSHEATRVRERGMRWSDISEFKSVKQAQGFLGVHASVFNLFNLGRHKVSAQHYRDLRISAFGEWSRAVA